MRLRFSCVVMVDMPGRSAFARLQLASYDVGAQMATDPIHAWARAVLDQLAGADEIRAAWQAVRTVAFGSRPFQSVAGPAGACCLKKFSTLFTQFDVNNCGVLTPDNILEGLQSLEFAADIDVVTLRKVAQERFF